MENIITPKKFNVRTYGLLFKANKVLVAHEYILGEWIVKFPGGGLEFGEGLENGLQREFIEELDLQVELGKLFYVNTFFQTSYFKPDNQLVCIYYEVSTSNLSHQVFEGTAIKIDKNLIVKWVAIEDLNQQGFSFPIDQKVAQLMVDKKKMR